MKWLKKIDHALTKIEGGATLVILLSMVGLSLTQLILRKFFHFGFDWADIFVRQMVMWLAFLGAAMATSAGRHIGVDIAHRLLPATPKRIVQCLTDLAALLLCVLLFFASIQFLKDAWDSGERVVGKIPAWAVNTIVPTAFFLISVHLLIHAIRAAAGDLEDSEAHLARGDIPTDPLEGNKP